MGSTVLYGDKIPLPRYSAIPPCDFEGDIEQAGLTAGQSAGNITEILAGSRDHPPHDERGKGSTRCFGGHEKGGLMRGDTDFAEAG